MSSSAIDSGEAETTASAVEALYRSFLNSWNERDAEAMAALFELSGYVVGFDGSLMTGPEDIATTIGAIFADHQTMPYVGIVRDVRLLAPDSAVLRAVAGMPARGEGRINPAVNAIQSLVAVQRDGEWRIALLQTTPAQFHRRPDLTEALTNELQQCLEEDMTHGSESNS